MGHRLLETRRTPLAARSPAAESPTGLIGRERELAVVRDLLLGGARLLTLTGPPGVGKTRLAREAAEPLRPSFAHGVVFVSLAVVVDAADVPLAIANAAGLADSAPSGEAGHSAALAAALRDRHVLLILDNFEHVTGAATVVADLLSACESLAVLVTSRAPLRLTAERELPIPPLAVSAPDDPTGGVPPEARGPADAERLFAQAARRVRPDFTLTAENAAAVAALCRALDGLPLAIELAAARVRVLSPDAIAREVFGRLSLLARGPRDVPARHQTLRAAIDWSHGLLTEDERRFFCRLAVFSGGFDAGAAAALLDSGAVPGQRAPETAGVADLLAGLAEQSLLAPAAGEAGSVRLSMLELIRAYALERLSESGEETEMRRRHAAHFRALAEEAEPLLRSRHQAAWVRRLKHEHANLRAALDWLLDRARDHSTEAAEWGLRLAGSLWWYWHLQGHNTEGREWLGAFLELPSAQAPTAERARALYGAGFLSWSSRFWAWEPASIDVSERYQEEALAIFRSLGDRRGEGYALWGLALTHYGRGQDLQLELLQQALAVFQEVGDDWGIVKAIEHISNVRGRRKEWDASRRILEEGNVVARRLGEPQNLLSNLRLLGDVLLRLGDLEVARECYAESRQVLSESGLLSPQSLTHMAFGRLALAEDDPATARGHFLEAHRAAQRLGSRTHGGEAVLGLATAVARLGDSEQALRLAGAGAALWEPVRGPDSLPPPLSDESLARFVADLERYRPRLARVRESVGDTRALTLMREGARMSVAEILEPPRTGRSSSPRTSLSGRDPESRDALSDRPQQNGAGSLPTLAPLSPREADTARLIARGLSNREIAAQLTITERTVMRHVEHILAKLDLRSRTQIALWVVERTGSNP